MFHTCCSTDINKALLAQVEHIKAKNPYAKIWVLTLDARAVSQSLAICNPHLSFNVSCMTAEGFIKALWETLGDAREFEADIDKFLNAYDVIVRLRGHNALAQGFVSCQRLRSISDIVNDFSLIPQLRASLHSEHETAYRMKELLECYEQVLSERNQLSIGDALYSFSFDEIASQAPDTLIILADHAPNQASISIIERLIQYSDVLLMDESMQRKDCVFIPSWLAALKARGLGVPADYEIELVLDDECELDDGDGAELAQIKANMACGKTPTLTPEGALRFILPAGAYAQMRCLEEALCECEADGLRFIRICTPNPLSSAQILAARHPKWGIRVNSTLPTLKTAVGAFLMRLMVLTDEDLDASWISDVVQSDFSKLKGFVAHNLDAQLKRYEHLSSREYQTLFETLAPHAAHLHKLMQEQDYESLRLILVEHIIAAVHIPEFMRKQELAACQILIEKLEATRSMESYARKLLLLSTQVPLSFERVAQQGHPSIEFSTLKRVSAFEPATYEALVLTDLNAEVFSCRTDPLPHTSFLDAIGCALNPLSLAQMRQNVARLISASPQLKRIYAERPLADVDGEPNNPSIIFGDLVDLYRSDLSSDEGIDKSLGIPSACVKNWCIHQGEDNFAQSQPSLFTQLKADAHSFSRGSSTTQLPANLVFCRGVGLNPDEYTALEAKSRHSLLTTDQGEVVCLSPSELELIMACPEHWLIERRLGVQDLRGGFDFMQLGTFQHEILQAFYTDILPKHGLSRMAEIAQLAANELDAEHIRVLLEQDFNQLFVSRLAEYEANAATKATMEACQGRYLVMQAPEDKERVLRTQADLWNLVCQDVHNIGFRPQYCELRVGYDKPFVYAGVLLRGCIDRVDVFADAEGVQHGIVLDYKSSVKSIHKASAVTESGLPARIQALVYAQALHRLQGINPVGAFYLSCKNNEMAGIGDPRFCTLGNPDKPGNLLKYEKMLLPKDSPLSTLSFIELLDAVEDAIYERLRALRSGYIQPKPQPPVPEVCTYCPSLSCPQFQG